MASHMIFDGCSICQTPFDSSSDEWFINDKDQNLHNCDDGNIGQKVEIDRDEEKAPDPDEEISPEEAERFRAQLQERLDDESNSERSD